MPSDCRGLLLGLIDRNMLNIQKDVGQVVRTLHVSKFILDFIYNYLSIPGFIFICFYLLNSKREHIYQLLALGAGKELCLPPSVFPGPVLCYT